MFVRHPNRGFVVCSHKWKCHHGFNNFLILKCFLFIYLVIYFLLMAQQIKMFPEFFGFIQCIVLVKSPLKAFGKVRTNWRVIGQTVY